MSARPAAVYRFYDADDNLLYIGASINILARFQFHSHDKPDWRQVARIEIAWYDSRDEALAVEKAAIIAEQPGWNSVHTPRHREAALARMPGPLTDERRSELYALLDDLLDCNRDAA